VLETLPYVVFELGHFFLGLAMADEPERYEHAQLMPPFHRFPEEGARIGRIIAAFGELQFILGLCLGEALDDRDTALRTIFLLASDRARIDVADSLLRPICAKTDLDQQFTETMKGMRSCHEIRNQYAHCHYGADSAGLFLTNLRDAADSQASFEYLWRHIDVPLLEEQERYFRYTTQCLNFIYDQLRIRLGRTGVPLSSIPWPTRLAPPAKHKPPSEHVPSWLGPDQQQRHTELALEWEYGAGLRPRPRKAPKMPKLSARARREAAMKKHSRSP
jgi:hypothetical protein